MRHCVIPYPLLLSLHVVDVVIAVKCINTNINWKLAKFWELLIVYHKTNIQPTLAFIFIVSTVFIGSVDTSIYKVLFNNIQHANNNDVD